MSNVLQIAWLIPILPLLGFVVNGAGRNILSRGLSGFIGSASVLASFLLGLYVFIQVKNGNTHVAHYFNFIEMDTLIPFDHYRGRFPDSCLLYFLYA
jgi:NADH-quinone oxidoreductase subunit L